MPERKRPRRTRERILETSLALFNRLGEPHVTTADIAGEMNISPGNLYYHFANKEAIVAELFAAFEAQVRPLLAERPESAAQVDDLWLLLHLLLERMQAYRFLYRDPVDLTTRYRRLGGRFGQLLQQGETTLAALCRGLVRRGAMHATSAQVASLARNAMLVVTHSTAYDQLRRPAASAMADPDFGRAAYYVLTLIAPYLVGHARSHVERLSRDYL